MRLTIFTANCTGRKSNSVYPDKSIIESPEEMNRAVRLDHVCAAYKDNRRSADNFIESDTVVMDCDNDHSDNPEDWITAQKMEKLFPDVSYVLVPSRHDGLPKDGRSARPRFHVYFSIRTVCDADLYVDIKKAIHRSYPFFDENALDAARFIFGSDRGECVWHEGWVTVDETLSEASDEEYSDCRASTIPEGSRNSTLSRFAGRVLKRYGKTEKAFDLFCAEATKCDPPLEDSELSTIWDSAVRFYDRKVSRQDGYVAPDQYNNDFANRSLRPDDYSDIGQAKVLAREYGNELRYTDGTDYIRFDGMLWIESRQQAVGAAEEFLDLQLQDAKDDVESCLKALEALGVSRADVIAGGRKLAAGLDARQLKALNAYLGARTYLDFVMQRRNMKFITSALQAAKPMLEIRLSDLDRDEFLLNTPGGTYDLRQGLEGVREPDAGDLITKQTSVAPGEDGRKLWEDTLDLVFSKDRELIDYVQMIVGLSAIGKVYVEALIIAYGEGSNGKSTFWNTISRVLGTYSGSISADALTVGCRRNVKPEMAELKGKRLVIASELEEGMRLNTSVIKQLCSTDEISAEKKYKDPFRFTPSHTLVLYTNHLPRVGANDAGTWRRLIVIPFDAKITGSGDIKNYSDFLYRNAGPYILSWIIEGAQKVIAGNYHIAWPGCVRDAVAAYRENNDWLGSFLEECCEIDQSFRQKSGEFYQEYRSYCARNGEYTRGTSDFYSALEVAGFSRRKQKDGVFIIGLRLKDDLLI